MTPFNLDQYLAGQPVITRDGTSVSGIRQVQYPGGYQFLTALIGTTPYIWTLGGYIFAGQTNDNDLMMDEIKVYKFVHAHHLHDVYENGDITVQIVNLP